MPGQILIYGATGYTGKLVIRTARQQGLRPIVAGRDLDRVRAVADPGELEWRTFGLADPGGLDRALRGVTVVLCLAGPFSATSRPMVDACLRQQVHYLDITGEIDVFEALAARDAEARRAGVMVLPGVGYDVVPTDCLAAQLKRRLPDAVDLKLYIDAAGAGISRGTAKTAIEAIAVGTRIRRGGRLVSLGRTGFGTCDFGQGPRKTVRIPWGDVATAFHSTGIPNIEVQATAPPAIRMLAGLPGWVTAGLGFGFAQSLMRTWIDRQPEGPSDEARRVGGSTVVGVACNARGDSVRSRLGLPDAYTLTAMTALEIASRVAGGEFKPGFQTPSLAYGADFIMGFDGVAQGPLTASSVRH